jgi:hypothetical protein
MTLSEIPPVQAQVPVDHVVAVGDRANPNNILMRAFYEPWLAGHQPSLRSGSVAASVAIADVLPPFLRVDRSIVDAHGAFVLARGARSTVMIEVVAGFTLFQVTAATDREAGAVLDDLTARCGPVPAPDLIDLNLWHDGRRRRRKIAAPLWPEVARNYPARTRAQLEELLAAERPVGRGKLVMWHGPPGTGKTSAIRALARTWSPWCGTQYISDPEKLFSDPNYLIEVLDSAPDARPQVTLDRVEDPDRVWQLIVAEDTDEYLLSNKGTEGALGRVLNMTDGLLGQSFNALLLLTTNEDLTRLHPALTRPGRCLAHIPFEPFSSAEAAEWLEGAVPTPASPSTLADLLVAKDPRQVSPRVVL